MSPKEKKQLNPADLKENMGKEPDLASFRAEITALIAEQKEKKHINMIELQEVNPEELTIEDADMWYRVKNYTKGSLTISSFKLYLEKVRNSNNASRENFYAVLANKITPILGNEELLDMDQ